MTPHFPAATFPTAINFFPQESNLRKALRLDLQRRKQKHVVSFRDNAYLRDCKFFQFQHVADWTLHGHCTLTSFLPCLLSFSCPQTGTAQLYNTQSDLCMRTPQMDRTGLSSTIVFSENECCHDIIHGCWHVTWWQAGKYYLSNPESPESTRDSLVWTWQEVQNPDGILFSMLRETESMVQKILAVSQKRKPRETESTREKSFKTWKTNSDTMKAARKYRWSPRRCTSRYGRELWLHRCRQECTWTRVRKRIWSYSRILNLRASKVCSGLPEWWSMKFRNQECIFSRKRCKFTLGNQYCLKSKQ